jgi:hypothetical protein
LHPAAGATNKEMHATTARTFPDPKNPCKNELLECLTEVWEKRKLECISGLFLAKSRLKLAKRQVS